LKGAISGIMLIALLIGMLVLVFNIQLVKASGTIYIRADGSIEPSTANITSVDNVTYTFTGNINDHIVVERDNIVVDGAGYSMEGTASGTAIDLSYRFNVTVKRVSISNFACGIALYYSSNNEIAENYMKDNLFAILLNYGSNNSISGNAFSGGSKCDVGLYDSLGNDISGNNMTFTGVYSIYLSNSSSNAISGNIMTYCRNGIYLENSSNNNVIFGNSIKYGSGIYLQESSNNTISENTITAWSGSSSYDGVKFVESSNNTVSGNTITTKESDGVTLFQSSNNTVSGNTITTERVCISLGSSSGNTIVQNNIKKGDYGICSSFSYNNMIYHNNIMDITWSQAIDNGNNAWDNGYPSGGNYWSNYNGTDFYSGPYQNETGSDGIGDVPYVINADNVDHYPLMEPWLPPDVAVSNATPSKIIVGRGCSLNVTSILVNQGNKIENLNMIVHANETIIAFQNFLLRSDNSLVYTFTWNTSDFTYGNYTISIYVEPIPGETDTEDNIYITSVLVTIPGDVDGDFDVDIYDVVKIACIYGSVKGDPEFNPNCDLDNDGEITIYDIVMCANNYGETYP